MGLRPGECESDSYLLGICCAEGLSMAGDKHTPITTKRKTKLTYRDTLQTASPQRSNRALMLRQSTLHAGLFHAIYGTYAFDHLSLPMARYVRSTPWC